MVARRGVRRSDSRRRVRRAGGHLRRSGPVYICRPKRGNLCDRVWGAQGGASGATSGGLGAGVGVDVTLSAGEDVLVYVGAQGGYGPAAGGGGSSAALLAPMEGLVAGGGGGGGFTFAGGNGVPPSLDGPGGAGGGFDGGSGGIFGSPGQYGSVGAPGGGITGYMTARACVQLRRMAAQAS